MLVMSKEPKEKDTATVFLGVELRAKLDEAAKQDRRTLSQLIRMVLEDWLEANPR